MDKDQINRSRRSLIELALKMYSQSFKNVTIKYHFYLFTTELNKHRKQLKLFYSLMKYLCLEFFGDFTCFQSVLFVKWNKSQSEDAEVVFNVAVTSVSVSHLQNLEYASSFSI